VVQLLLFQVNIADICYQVDTNTQVYL